MARVPKVRAWSNTVRKDRFHPGDVDLFVLRDHQPVLRALGRERADEGADADRRGRDRSGLLRGAAMLAPVFAVAAGGGRVPGRSSIVADPMPDDVAVVYCALLFLVAVPGPALVALRWLSAHRRRDWLEVVYLVVTTLIGTSVLTSMVADWDVAPYALPTLPVWVTTVTAAAVLLAVAVASRGRRTQGDLCFRVVGEPDPAKARQMIEAMPARMREQLHDMRTRAVETLTKRGVVDADEARRITSTPLGEGPLARS